MNNKIIVTTKYNFKDELRTMLKEEKYKVLSQFEHPNEITGDKEYSIIVSSLNKNNDIPALVELGFEYDIPLLVSDN